MAARGVWYTMRGRRADYARDDMQTGADTHEARGKSESTNITTKRPGRQRGKERVNVGDSAHPEQSRVHPAGQQEARRRPV